MPSKKHIAKSSPSGATPSIAFYRNIAVTFLILTVLLLLTVAYMSVKKVTVRITVAPMTVQARALARVGQEAKDMPHITGVTGKMDVTVTREFTPKGTKTQDHQATGKVTLTNTTTKNQPLVATTRLLTSDGVLFRIKSGTVVPANGNVEVAVYADKPGKSGEIGPTKFTIPGLAESLQAKITGESTASMTGGVVTIGIVSKEDIEKAKEEMQKAAQEEAGRELRKREVDSEAMGFLGVIDAIAYEVTSSEDKEVSSFSVTAKAVVVGALYRTEEARELVNNRLQEKINRQPVKLLLGDALPEVTVEGHDPAGLWMQIAIAGGGTTELTEDSPAFDAMKFAGKTREEIETYARSIEGVKDVSVRFRPAWSTVAPRVPEHIEVKVER